MNKITEHEQYIWFNLGRSLLLLSFKKMKQLDWRTFIVGLAFLSGTVFAMETFYGDLGEDDWVFETEVLIDGVELPEEQEDLTGTSTVVITGTGTLTVGNRVVGMNDLNVTVFGGTTIESERKWDEGDVKRWFEGILPAPREGRKPSFSDVEFDDGGMHSNSSVHVLSVVGMGLPNETFSFSTPAAFTFPARIPDATKLWLAFKEEVTPSENDDAEWTIEEGDFCVVTDGLCQVELDEFNEVALVQEYFQKCPRTSSSDTDVTNGSISGPPECLITCDNGYELDYADMKCVLGDGVLPPSSGQTPISYTNTQVTTGEATVPSSSRPGYYRYTGARPNQMEYEGDSTGLGGSAKDRIGRLNATARSRMTSDDAEEEERAGLDDDFMNYMLYIRNFFGAGASANVVRSGEVEIGENGEAVYSSAPLLPSTGPGIFLGLAAIGLGCMVVGAKGRRK